MSLSLPLVIATLLGCPAEAPVDPAKSALGRLCDRAFISTIDSLTDVFTQAGKPLPTWPDKAGYVEKCLSLGLNEAQLKCLDPKWVGGDPAGCRDELEPVKAKSDELTKWFGDAMNKDAKTEGTEEEAAEGEGAEAEGDE